MRAKVEVEEIRKDREALIVSAIPYQVNKKTLIEKIADLVREKRVEGISDIWDETNREGMRIVIELKRDAVADVVLNQLYRFSDLQTSFGANMLAINGGRPESLNLKDMVEAFTNFREEVVSRRTKFLLTKARERAHVLVGLAIAVANIDEVIKLIRHAASPAAAREQLMERDWPAHDIAPLVMLIADPRHKVSDKGTYKLSEEQAKAILELRLARLTALGRDEIADELKKIGEEIKEYLAILASRLRVVEIVRKELTDIRDEFATPRKTEIVEMEGDLEDEDLIQREDCVVTVSLKGYVKRVPLATYRAQRRGGKGRSGVSTREEDVVTKIFVASTHTPVLFFSSRGMCYRMKVWRLPASTPQATGKALVNLLPLQQGEVITSILPLPEDPETWGALQLAFATRSGKVRRNALSDFENINRNGKIAMKLDDGDAIVAVQICTPENDVLLTSAQGRCIRFLLEDEVRLFKGRDSDGVRGIKLDDGDQVISMTILTHVEAEAGERAAYLKQATMLRRAQGDEIADAVPDAESDEEVVGEAELTSERFAELGAKEQFVLTVSEKGFGKRSSSYEYRTSGPRRQRHRRHGRQRPQRAAGRVLPGRAERPDHAGDGRRPAHPLPGRRRAHRGAQHARRARVQDRCRGARRLGRAHPRGIRGRGERRGRRECRRRGAVRRLGAGRVCARPRGLFPFCGDATVCSRKRARERAHRAQAVPVRHQRAIAAGARHEAAAFEARHDAAERIGVERQIVGDLRARQRQLEGDAGGARHAEPQRQLDQERRDALLAVEAADDRAVQDTARVLVGEPLVEVLRERGLLREQRLECARGKAPKLGG